MGRPKPVYAAGLEQLVVFAGQAVHGLDPDNGDVLWAHPHDAGNDFNFQVPLWGDDTIMPWGKHKGVRLGDVPVGYLLWLFRHEWVVGPEHCNIYNYLKENQTALLQEEQEQDSGPGGGFDSYEDYERYGR